MRIQLIIAVLALMATPFALQSVRDAAAIECAEGTFGANHACLTRVQGVDLERDIRVNGHDIGQVISRGPSPTVCGSVGDLFMDTDVRDQSGCPTREDNTLCVCSVVGRPGTWKAIE